MADRTVTYQLRAEIGAFKAQMAQASAAVRHSADEMTAATKKGATFRAGLTTLGSTAGKVGLVAAVGLGAAVLQAAKFDEAMAHVNAATHESAANMALLRDAALEAGARTVFSATEAAGAIEALAKAGVSTSDILNGGLNAALDLASAGTLDVSQAAEIAATTMNQFGLAGSDASRAADVLSAAAGKAQGEVTDIAEALKYVGPVAHQMGVSLEEAGGSIAYLATQGIQGEQAGTGLRGMLLSLTSPSKQASDTLKQLGISMYDAQGHFIGLDGVAGQLHESMKGLTESERDEALGRIFGNAQVTTARILYAGGAKAIKDWTNAVDDSGYASETAARKLDSLMGDLEQLGGALQTAFISAGEGQQNGLRGLVQGLTELVNGFNKLPGPAKGATTSLLGVAAVVGGGTWFASKAIVGVSEMRKALDDLGPAGTRAAAGLRAVSILAAAGMGLDVALNLAAQLNHTLDQTAPNIYVLRSNLKDLANGGDIKPVVDDVGDLQTAIEAISDPTAFKAISDFYNKLPVFGSVLPNMLDIAPISGDRLRELREAQTSIDGLDQALSSLAVSDGPRAARQAFQQLADTYHLTAEQQGNLISLLPTAQDFLQGLGDSARKAAAGTSFFGQTTHHLLSLFGPVAEAAGIAGAGIKGMGNKAGPTAERLKALQQALEDDRKAASDTASEFFNLGNKLDDAKVSLSQWLRDLEKQAQALRDFRINAQQAAKRGLDQGLIASLEEAGTAGALRMRQLANATDAEIKRANRAWQAGQREIEKYVDATVHVPRALATDINLNGVPEAEGNINRLTSYLHALDRLNAQPDVSIGGIPQSIADLNALQARINSIQGKTITNTVRTLGGPAAGGMASGGTVPGMRQPYGDKTYIFAAPGEEVISNRFGEADRFRADRAAGRIPAYAGGGTVGMQRVQSSSRQHVEFAPARVDIRLPNGDIQSVELIARATVRSEMSADRRWQNRLDDRD